MKRSILVAEPDRLAAEDIRKILIDAGFDVSGVVPGAGDAIRMCSKSKPDLLVTAIDLNGAVDGIETAGFIRRHFGVPAVYVTSLSDQDILAGAKETKSCGLLPKPVKARELVAAAELALLHSRQDAEKGDGEADHLISMCAWCKRVKDKSGVWTESKAHLGEQNDVEFTHGICPECREASLRELHSVPAGPALLRKQREQRTAASARGSFVQ
jgi:DNA-binding response OmpR family regulator